MKIFRTIHTAIGMLLAVQAFALFNLDGEQPYRRLGDFEVIERQAQFRTSQVQELTLFRDNKSRVPTRVLATLTENSGVSLEIDAKIFHSERLNCNESVHYAQSSRPEIQIGLKEHYYIKIVERNLGDCTIDAAPVEWSVSILSSNTMSHNEKGLLVLEGDAEELLNLQEKPNIPFATN